MLESSPVGNEEIADWLEIAIVAGGSKGNTNHKLQKWGLDWCNLSELQVSAGLKTMERRQALLGEKYPFDVNDLAVVFHESHALSVYSYLLSISRPTNSTPWQTHAPTQEESDLFEEFVASTLKDYLGNAAQAIPFGWPSKFGRPQEFYLAIEWLANLMAIKVGQAYRPPRRKDGGVDVIAWRPFKDKRSGFPIYLVQCTLQKDFVSKSRDIDLRLWAGWLELDRDPVTVLAIPVPVAPGEPWNEVTANAIIFDRARMTDANQVGLNVAQKEYLQKIILTLRQFAAHHLD